MGYTDHGTPGHPHNIRGVTARNRRGVATNQPGAAPLTRHGKTAKTTNQGQRENAPHGRHIQDPLKQMRQKQAAEAKLLATQQRKRSDVLTEQAKIREAKAVEKAANEERLKTLQPQTLAALQQTIMNKCSTHSRDYQLRKKREIPHPTAPLRPKRRIQRSSQKK